MNDAGTERAFATFKTNVKRASYFLDIHEKIQKGPGSPPKANRELPREALVFVVGALDTFLGDWSASVIIEGMRKGSSHGNAKTVLEQVQKRIPTLSLEVALISDEESRITYIDEAITKYFYSQTSQHGAKAVSAAVDLSGNAPRTFWQAVVATSGDDPHTRLDSWTDKRHRIVHRGEAVRVHRSHAHGCISLVTGIAEEMMNLEVAPVGVTRRVD